MNVKCILSLKNFFRVNLLSFVFILVFNFIVMADGNKKREDIEPIFNFIEIRPLKVKNGMIKLKGFEIRGYKEEDKIKRCDPPFNREVKNEIFDRWCLLANKIEKLDIFKMLIKEAEDFVYIEMIYRSPIYECFKYIYNEEYKSRKTTDICEIKNLYKKLKNTKKEIYGEDLGELDEVMKEVDIIIKSLDILDNMSRNDIYNIYHNIQCLGRWYNMKVDYIVSVMNGLCESKVVDIK